MPSTTDRPTHPALAAAARYVAPEHLTHAAVDRMRDWYRSDRPRPLALRDFLRPELARSLGDALRAIPTWSRHAAIYQGRSQKTEFWEEVEPGLDLTATQFVVRDIKALLDEGVMDLPHQRALEQFLLFSVLSDGLRDWLKAGTGLDLRKQTLMEFAAYRASDGLGAHQDLVPGRVLAVNFYLDQDYRPDQGGRLGFRNGSDEEFHVPPVFNSISVFPVREDCWHWVEPFRGDAVGRYTIAIGQHLEGS